MRKSNLLSLASGLIVSLFSQFAFGQGMSINATGTPANASAILDAQSTTQGFLPPRMTTAQRNAIATPAAGLMIYNLDCDEMNFFSIARGWTSVYGGGIATATAPTSVLSYTGFTANWTPAAGNVSAYYLDVANDSAFSAMLSGYNNINVGTALNLAVTYPCNPSNMYYRIRANFCSGPGANSNVMIVPASGVPYADVATGVSFTTFTANWFAPADPVTGYFLDVATDIGFTSIVSGYNNLSVGNVLTTNVTVPCGLLPYYYRLRSTFCTGVFSAYSNVMRVDPLSATPIATAASNVVLDSFKANWTAPSAAVTAYYLDVSADSLFSTFVSVYHNLNVGNVLIKNVQVPCGLHRYFYRLRSTYCSGTFSPYSNTTSVDSLIAVPVATAPSAVVPDFYTANWTAPTANVTGYYLDVATNSTFTTFVSGYNNLSVGNVVSRNITVPCGVHTYYYRVRSIYCGVFSAYSNTDSVHTGHDTQVFAFTGGLQSYTVPCGVTSLTLSIKGSDGDGGGTGATVNGTLTVTPGQVLSLIVGGTNGYGGGGGYGYGGYYWYYPTSSSTYYYGHRGGGRSAIQIAGVDRVTAGGGGGASDNGVSIGFSAGLTGGGGGATNGGDQYYGSSGAGKAATVSAGGAGSTGCDANGSGGGALSGGNGANSSGASGSTPGIDAYRYGAGGGGGGGGYFGGGGGGATNSTTNYGGGGGGSSYITGAGFTGTNTPGTNSRWANGNGQITITY